MDFNSKSMESLLHEIVPFVGVLNIKIDKMQSGNVKLSYTKSNINLTGEIYSLCETAAGVLLLSVMEDFLQWKPVVKESLLTLDKMPFSKVYATGNLSSQRINNIEKQKDNNKISENLEILILDNQCNEIGKSHFNFILRKN